MIFSALSTKPRIHHRQIYAAHEHSNTNNMQHINNAILLSQCEDINFHTLDVISHLAKLQNIK